MSNEIKIPDIVICTSGYLCDQYAAHILSTTFNTKVITKSFPSENIFHGDQLSPMNTKQNLWVFGSSLQKRSMSFDNHFLSSFKKY